MGLKRQLLDAVKESCPNFDETKDWFVIEFEGAGDNFDSFHSFEIGSGDWPQTDRKVEGVFDTDLHNELLYDILETSGAEHNWNNAGTSGKIEYSANQPGVLEVTTTLLFEDYGTVEDEDEETVEE
jgi:hypothetical protein